jgi:hypothetical protein
VSIESIIDVTRESDEILVDLLDSGERVFLGGTALPM